MEGFKRRPDKCMAWDDRWIIASRNNGFKIANRFKNAIGKKLVLK